jgi:integrase
MTRYPKAGKGRKWTIKELEVITSDWKGDTLSDGDGLSGQVRFNSDGGLLVAFRYAFKWEGKVNWFYCGSFPANDLSDIRLARDEASDLIKQGIDPRVKKIANKIESRNAVNQVIKTEEKRKSEALTVKDMFDNWVADGVRRKDNNKYIIQTFNKYITPVLGREEVRNIDEQHLSKVYKKIVADGKNTTAFELSKDVKQMFTWAEKRKPWRTLMADGNPAALVEINKILPADFTKIRERVVTIEELKKLKAAFDTITYDYGVAEQKYSVERPLKKEVQHAMWLCLSTLCRIGELLMSEWVHIDFEKRTWFIPAANTKKVGRRKQTDHLVYLSDFALFHFKELKDLTGDTNWVFPATYKVGHVCVKSASKQIGDRQVKFKKRTKKHQFRVENNSLVVGDVEWTPHDLRTTGATMMQQLDVPREIINLCQHHAIGSQLDRHYLFHEFKDKQRDAWERLGKKLNEILS